MLLSLKCCFAAEGGWSLFLGWLREVSLATVLATCVVSMLIIAGRSQHLWLYYLFALPVVYALVVLLTLHLLHQTVGDLAGLKAVLKSNTVRKRALLAAAAAGLVEGITCILSGSEFAWLPQAVATSTAAGVLWGVLPVLLVAFHVGSVVHGTISTNVDTHEHTLNTADVQPASCSDWVATLTGHIVDDARTASAHCSCSRRLCPWLHAALTSHDAAPMPVDAMHRASLSPALGPLPSPQAAAAATSRRPHQHTQRRNSRDGRQLCACACKTGTFLGEQLPIFGRALGTSALRLRDYSHSTLAMLSCCVAGTLLPWADVLALPPGSISSSTVSDDAQDGGISWWLWALVVLGPIVIASALTDAAGVLLVSNPTYSEAHEVQGGVIVAQVTTAASAPPLPPRSAQAAALGPLGSTALRRIGLALVLSVTLLHTPAFTALQLQDQFQYVEQWLLVGQLRRWHALTGQQHVLARPVQHSGARNSNSSALSGGSVNPWAGSGSGLRPSGPSVWGGDHAVGLHVELGEGTLSELPSSVSAILLTGHNLLASFWHVLVTLIWLAVLQAFTLLWQQVLWAANGRQYSRGDLMWPAQLWFYLQYYTLYCVNDSRPFLAFVAVLVLINVDYYFAAVGGYTVLYTSTANATQDAAAAVLLQRQQGEKFQHILPVVRAALQQLAGGHPQGSITPAASPTVEAASRTMSSPVARDVPEATGSSTPQRANTQRTRRGLMGQPPPGQAGEGGLSAGSPTVGVCHSISDSAGAVGAVLRPACVALQGSCWRVAFTGSVAYQWCAFSPYARSQARTMGPSAAEDGPSDYAPPLLVVVDGESERRMQYRHEKTYWDAAADISTLAVMGVSVSLLEVTGDLNGRLGAAFGFSQTPLLQMWWQLLAMLFARLVTTLAASHVQAAQARHWARAAPPAKVPQVEEVRGTWTHAARESIVHCGFLLLVTLACFQQPGLPMRFAFQDGS